MNPSAEQTFQKILQDYKALVFKVAQLYTTNTNDRNDLLQEIAIQLYQAMPKYNHSVKLSTWIYRIALNVSISYLRKEQTRSKINQPLLHEHTLEIEPDTSAKKQQIQLLYQAVSQLKEIDKAIIILYLDGEPQAEIAQILGLSVSNVSTKINRIKEQLKTIMKQLNA